MAILVCCTYYKLIWYMFYVDYYVVFRFFVRPGLVCSHRVGMQLILVSARRFLSLILCSRLIVIGVPIVSPLLKAMLLWAVVCQCCILKFFCFFSLRLLVGYSGYIIDSASLTFLFSICLGDIRRRCLM